MSSVPVLPERLDWPSAIGLFLINFGTLEYLVFIFLKDHLPPEHLERVKKLHFKDRVDRVTKLLSDEKYSAEQQAAFARLLERLQPIRELRNHIAHGYMYIRVDPKTQKLTLTLLKAKDPDTELLPDTKHVEFAELEKALPTLTELIEEFKQLAGFS